MGKTPVPLHCHGCWQSAKLSDIQIQIVERIPDDDAGSSRPCKRQCDSTRTGSGATQPAIKFTIPCSKGILAAGSLYFKTRFLSDLEEGVTEFPLLVGEGEADAAFAVIRSMYEGLPEDATVPQLILMYKVADRLQATSTGVIAEALTQLPCEAWTWEDVIMVRSHAIAHVTSSNSMYVYRRSSILEVLSSSYSLHVQVVTPAELQQTLPSCWLTSM